MRFLMAEDDAVLGRAVCAYLMRDGHAVDWAVTGNQVLSYLRTYSYDCVLLDLNLPELPGRDCLADARARGNQTPVIVTSASGSSSHRIDLLDIGADDFLPKPFDLHELGARVRAVVRRSQQPAETREQGLTTYGPLTLQPNSGSVTWHGRSIPLTVKEFMVLETLLKRPNRVVQRHQLEAEVYGWNDPIESNSIEVHVHYLRRKINPQLIQTVRGVGYQLCDARQLTTAVAPSATSAAAPTPAS